MKVMVQKFGGTSLKKEEDRNKAASYVNEAVNEGYKVIVVVSAMGRKTDPYATDTLLELINAEEAKISNREFDLLASCGEIISSVVFSNLLNHTGLKATAMTGAQAGFRTNDDYRRAKIIDIKTDELQNTLNSHDVVVVTGFQGQTENGEVTTIGRGGSDTSAAALGAAIKAEQIDIFTDVDGVMTADPRLVSEAIPLSVVSYNEICNMAYQGAKVIHPRAVEIAMQSKVPIRIRSTQSGKIGTLVTSIVGERPGRDIQERLITGIAHVGDVTQIKVSEAKEKYDLQMNVFKAMAENDISVDLININPNGVVYTVMDKDTDTALKALEDYGYQPEVVHHCAKVSAVGAGIAGVPGVAAQIVSALAGEGIQILQSADSHTTIWVLVKQDDLVTAVNVLHDTFSLGRTNSSDAAEAEKR